MVELRTLHFTDIHDEWEKYELVSKLIADKKDTDQAVDAVMITGDFIEGHIVKDKTAFNIVEGIKSLSENPSREEEELKAFLQKHQKDGKIDLHTLDEAQQKEFETLDAKISARIEGLVNKIVSDAYQIHADKISALGIPVYGIMGNHDLTLGYEILKDKVTFVEKTNKATIKGKSGIKFVVKGDLNTIEVPPLYTKLAPAIGKDFIPYESGYSLSDLSKTQNTLQKILSESPTERLEKIKKGEEPQYSDEQIGKMEAQLKEIQEFRPKVLEYNQAERKRLGDKNEADIYLTHKLPNCKKANPKMEGSVSDATAEYAANAKAVYGGHFHEGQIGYKTIEDFLKQASTEKTTVDGVEVPVYYLDDKEPWELNPGTKYVFVTEYDAKKEIEQVIVYEFVEYEEA